MLKEVRLTGEQKKVLFFPAQNPIQIKGVAGSGKTTVALYRAKHLLDTQNTLFHDANIVIFTFNKTLAAYIKALAPFVSSGYKQESEEITPTAPKGLNVEVVNFHSWAYRFAGLRYGQTLNSSDQKRAISSAKAAVIAAGERGSVLSKSDDFFMEEISWMKGKLLAKEEEYIDAKRVGRGKSDRITGNEKMVIWRIFKAYEEHLTKLGKIDFDDYAHLCLEKIDEASNFSPPYTHIVVDEAQDLNKAQILTISKLVDPNTNSLSIIADAAQRIYKSGFVWSEVGINVRGGRTIEFRKNYRNTVHIANAAISLLSKEGDKSEFTKVEAALKGGEKTRIGYFKDSDLQAMGLLEELKNLSSKDDLASTIVLHRTNKGVQEIAEILESNGFSIEHVKSNNAVDYSSGSIKICTMSSVKGLEFNNVFIIDLNDDVIPFPPGFSEPDDEYHVSTERRLLYTSMTRARKGLWLFSSGNPSRYLAEINNKYLVDLSKL